MYLVFFCEICVVLVFLDIWNCLDFVFFFSFLLIIFFKIVCILLIVLGEVMVGLSILGVIFFIICLFLIIDFIKWGLIIILLLVIVL